MIAVVPPTLTYNTDKLHKAERKEESKRKKRVYVDIIPICTQMNQALRMVNAAAES